MGTGDEKSPETYVCDCKDCPWNFGIGPIVIVDDHFSAPNAKAEKKKFRRQIRRCPNYDLENGKGEEFKRGEEGEEVRIYCPKYPLDKIPENGKSFEDLLKEYADSSLQLANREPMKEIVLD